jgi:hypothetical protein
VRWFPPRPPGNGARAVAAYAAVEQHFSADRRLYWDHVDLEGRVDTARWSYDQGAMLGASLLHCVTGEPACLERARQIASAALEHSGAEDRLHAQPPALNAIFFRNLLLEAETHDGSARPAMQAYADAVWRRARDAHSELFHFDPARTYALKDQAAMVQVFALLSWEAGGYRLLA